MHVVQVLAPLADEGVHVVVDDLEASEARAMSMPSDDDTESSAISRSGADADEMALSRSLLFFVHHIVASG